MELVEIFYILGIIFMTTWLLFLVVLGVLFIKIRWAIREAREEFQKRKIEAEGVVNKFSGVKILGILPIMPILVFVARRIFRGIRKKIFL